MPEQVGSNNPAKMVREGDLVAIKKQLKDAERKLASKEEETKNLERELEWAKSISGDEGTEKIKKEIFQANLELDQRRQELDDMSSELAGEKSKIAVQHKAAQYGCDVSFFEGCEDEKDMDLKANEAIIAAFSFNNNETRETKPSGLEFGSQIGGQKLPKDMSDDEFQGWLKNLHKEASERGKT